jgi:hypothetical protein
MGDLSNEQRGRRGIDELSADIARHRVLLIGDRNVVYRQALEHINALIEGPHADSAVVAKLERSWRERWFVAYYERPLLLLAAIRHDVLSEGPKHPLARGFATENPDPAHVTRERVRAALAPERASLWLSLIARRVQTNETSRAFVWMWPALLGGCDSGARPLALVDVGASAGLQLVADRLKLSWRTKSGAALPVVTGPRCELRLGFDTHPLDIRYDDDVLWMRACLWPGEVDRHARFDAAVAAMRAAYDGAPPRPELVALNAVLVPGRLERIVRGLPKGTLTIAYQTFVRGYFERDREQMYARGMEAWLAKLPAGSAAWIEVEIADDANELPATIVAHVPDGAGSTKKLDLGRCGYHPIEIAINEAAAADLAVRLRQA